MALDAKTWLLEQGFSEAEATEMAPRFAPERLSSIEKGYLRQQDYSTKMNEMSTAQAELAEANKRLNAEMAEWATVTAAGGELTKKQEKALEKAQSQVAILRTRVESLAGQAGVDPKTILADLDTATPPPAPGGATPPGFDPSQFVTADAFNRQYAQMTNLMVTLPGEMFNLATEHQQLFGKPLDTAGLSKEIMTRAQTRGNQKSLDPRVVWEETHGVAAKRDEVAKAKYDADIKAAEERGRQDAITNSAVPGSPTAPGTHAIVFGNGQRKSALDRPQPGSTVSRAVTALRAGTYRTPQPTAK